MPLPFFGRKVDPVQKKEVLDYYLAATLVTAYQDEESGKYNAVLGNHIATLTEAESLAIVMVEAVALGVADKEAIRRQTSIKVPDMAGKDWAAWLSLYMKHLEWIEASHAAFQALGRGADLPTARVQALAVEAERKRQEAEKASGELLAAVGAKPNDIAEIMKKAGIGS